MRSSLQRRGNVPPRSARTRVARVDSDATWNSRAFMVEARTKCARDIARFDSSRELSSAPRTRVAARRAWMRAQSEPTPFLDVPRVRALRDDRDNAVKLRERRRTRERAGLFAASMPV